MSTYKGVASPTREKRELNMLAELLGERELNDETYREILSELKSSTYGKKTLFCNPAEYARRIKKFTDFSKTGGHVNPKKPDVHREFDARPFVDIWCKYFFSKELTEKIWNNIMLKHTEIMVEKIDKEYEERRFDKL